MKQHKPVILALVRYYLPGYKSGGPVRSISNMVDRLGDYFDYRIVTSDRDCLDPIPYGGVALDAWNTVGKAKVYYLSQTACSPWTLARVCAQIPHDVLYLNSFFDPVFAQAPLLARRMGLLPEKPAVIAPRGELNAGALAIKRWRKAPYKRFTSALGLYQNLTWHASSDHECADIRRAVGTAAGDIVVAPNLPPVSRTDPQEDCEGRRVEDPLRIVFLSRIVPKKNLDYALRILSKISVPVRFDIYGPVGSEPYWNKCKALMADLPTNVSARYCGAVDHSQVSSVLRGYDLFFLPTRGENYGHVLMESLSAGTPLLIADTTPWRELARDGVGWELPLDLEQQFVDRIQIAAKVTNEEYKAWRKRVRTYAQVRLNQFEVIDANRRLFTKAAAKGNSWELVHG